MKFRSNGRERESVREFRLSGGTVIGVFEGSRGFRKDRDVLIKYREKGKRLRTPKHIHWVIDLLIKKEHDRELALEFMGYLRGMYDRVGPFADGEDRKRCVLTEVSDEKLKRFEGLNGYGEYKVDFMAHLIELMIKMEKNTPPERPARVFRELMDALLEEKEIFVVVGKATQTR